MAAIIKRKEGRKEGRKEEEETFMVTYFVVAETVKYIITMHCQLTKYSLHYGYPLNLLS